LKILWGALVGGKGGEGGQKFGGGPERELSSWTISLIRSNGEGKGGKGKRQKDNKPAQPWGWSRAPPRGKEEKGGGGDWQSFLEDDDEGGRNAQEQGGKKKGGDQCRTQVFPPNCQVDTKTCWAKEKAGNRKSKKQRWVASRGKEKVTESPEGIWFRSGQKGVYSAGKFRVK